MDMSQSVGSNCDCAVVMMSHSVAVFLAGIRANGCRAAVESVEQVRSDARQRAASADAQCSRSPELHFWTLSSRRVCHNTVQPGRSTATSPAVLRLATAGDEPVGHDGATPASRRISWWLSAGLCSRTASQFAVWIHADDQELSRWWRDLPGVSSETSDAS